MINAIAIDDEPLALTVIKSLCDKNDNINLQRTFTQPSEALRYLHKYPVDLIFCDIQMPAMTGINLVKALPSIIISVICLKQNTALLHHGIV